MNDLKWRIIRLSSGSKRRNCLELCFLLLQIQVAVEECKEHLKVVNSLGVEKLRQNLENTLQLLAEQDDCIIFSINIATDPECSVRTDIW